MQKLDLVFMSNVIRDVMNTFGKDILMNEHQFCAALKDCMGIEMTRLEGKILIFTAEIGFGTLFSKLDFQDNSWMYEIESFRDCLSAQYGINDFRINEFIYAYFTAIDKTYLFTAQYADMNKAYYGTSVIPRRVPINTDKNKQIWGNKSKYSYGVRYIEDYDIYRDRKRSKIWNIIKKGDDIPIVNESISRKVFDGVTETTFFIYESESLEDTYEPEEGRLVGYLRISGIRDSRSGDETKLSMSVDQNGIMTVRAIDLKSGITNQKKIQLS